MGFNVIILVSTFAWYIIGARIFYGEIICVILIAGLDRLKDEIVELCAKNGWISAWQCK